MRNIDAIGILECMATDMIGAITNLSKRSPMYDVIKQRLEAINMAQDTLRVAMSTSLNQKLTLADLRKMETERVWVQFRDVGMYALVAYHSDPDGDDGDDVYLTNNLGGRSTYDEIIGEGGVIFRKRLDSEVST